ncbi:hypothetical protein GOP47_0004380 [Adiantum capillus-veneris]|uniref:Uncharacterized protein n=1 Tax=Adiantum capillus-veneris TaxID=13818 RepID=A0A9D4V802_ADICA|nr:hypothetical protein GOP47_0004380 [Adiantum capillus-veneris]
MPFRRKNRSSLFGSSSRSGDKENANVENMQEPLLQSQPTGLFRCHSDNSQRFCCDINPNTMGAHQHQHQRVLSTKEKMSNLLQLNTTLVKEVSSLRASQLSLTMNMEDLSGKVQAKSLIVNALESEKKELAEEVSQLGKAQLAAKETFEAEKKDVEDRLECVSLVVDNLQTMNGVLAEEAARLREDADRYLTEKHTLLADLDKILGEKSILEELVDSLRASEESFRKEVEQALENAEFEKKSLCKEKQALLSEKNDLLAQKDDLHEDVLRLTKEKASLLSQIKDQGIRQEELQGELSVMVSKNCEAAAQLKAESQTSEEAHRMFDAERRELLASRKELENSITGLRKEHEHSTEQFEAERQVLKGEVKQLASHITQLAHEKEELHQCLEKLKKMKDAMQTREISQQEELSKLQGEVDESQLRIQGLLAQEKVQQDELCKLHREVLLTNNASKESQIQAEAAMTKAVKEKDDIIQTLRSRVYDAETKIGTLEGEQESWKSKESVLQSNILSLECKLSSLQQSLNEAIAQATAKGEEACTFKEKLDKASQAITSLEGKFAAEKVKHKLLEALIQTMKGDLLVAEDVAIQAKNKAVAVEKEAGMAIERKAREASQKIGALESKLAAMAERQSDLENLILVKENACKAAVQSESVANARLSGFLGSLQERGKAMEVYFEDLKAAMFEIQNNAMRANQGITCLQAEFAGMMDVKVNYATIGNGKAKKRRGRSRASKACHPNQV